MYVRGNKKECGMIKSIKHSLPVTFLAGGSYDYVILLPLLLLSFAIMTQRRAKFIACHISFNFCFDLFCTCLEWKCTFICIEACIGLY